MKKKIKLNGVYGTRKGLFESTNMLVFKNSSDNSNGIPPLFSLKVIITNIDLERIDAIENVEVTYKYKLI